MSMKLPRQVLVTLAMFAFTNPAFGVESVRIAYPYLSSSVFYVLIAENEGFYKQEGLAAEFVSIRGDLAIKAAITGDVDAFTTASGAIVAALRGIPVKVLAITQDKLSLDLIVQPHVKTFSQLRGSTIGITSPESSIALATKEMLRSHGLDPEKDIRFIILGGDNVRLISLKENRIQATLLDAATGLKAVKDGFVKLDSAAEYMRYIQGGLATSDQTIKRNSVKLSRFIIGSLKGLRLFLTKPELSINYIMKLMKYNDRQLATAIYNADSKVMLRDGLTNEKLLRELMEDMKLRLKINRVVNVSEVFDFSFVERANDQLRISGWEP
jgi:ABC-type nitrate/sulfonate/bicarbonate transport system substrate-binding protein